MEYIIIGLLGVAVICSCISLVFVRKARKSLNKLERLMRKEK